jgi:hypothetical protein
MMSNLLWFFGLVVDIIGCFGLITICGTAYLVMLNYLGIIDGEDSTAARRAQKNEEK